MLVSNPEHTESNPRSVFDFILGNESAVKSSLNRVEIQSCAVETGEENPLTET